MTFFFNWKWRLTDQKNMRENSSIPVTVVEQMAGDGAVVEQMAGDVAGTHNAKKFSWWS